MMNKVLVLVLATLIGHGVYADSRSFGKCPHIDPVDDFQMQKMLGTWYTIQKTATNVPCLSYNITEKHGHPGHYLLTETFLSSRLSKLVGLGHEYHVTGELCAIDETKPAVMDLKVPLDIGTYKFTVFMTDYLNWAAVFSCKTYPLTFSSLSKWSAMILSRRPTLDIEFVEKVRSRLSAYNINPFSLSIIDQHHCQGEKKGVVVKAASDVFNKVSNTIGDFNEEVIKPVVNEAVDSMKNFINNEKGVVAVTKPKIDEKANAFSTAIDQVNGGLNTLFDHSDLDVRTDTETGGNVPPTTGPPRPSYLGH